MRTRAAREDPALLRLLDARQYALKMIANVTYGYAGASLRADAYLEPEAANTPT